MATIRRAARYLRLDRAPRRAGQFISTLPRYKRKTNPCHDLLCPHHEVYASFRFGNEELERLEAEEVRVRFPRWEGPCPSCGERLIAYASPEHYIAGDW